MAKFELIEPRTLEEACAAFAADEDAKAIAGGTALLTLLKQGMLRPKRLINLKKVVDASAIEFDPLNGLRIGALAPIAEIENCNTVRELYPALAEACRTVANIRIRNMATIGGNLAHADPQSDPPTVLAALDARLELRSRRSLRTLPFSEFQAGGYETALAPDELLSAILLPPPPPGLTGLYIKFTTGSSGERPCAGAAAFTRRENGICRELRLAIGAVSPGVVRMTSPEARARNRPLDAALIQSIASEASDAVRPVDDIRGTADYKRRLVQVLIRRALAALANGTELNA